MEIIVRNPLGIGAFDGLALDASALARVKTGVVRVVKESFSGAAVVNRREAERRMDVAVRFVLRCVGDGHMTPDRALAFLPAALPVEMAGLEYPVPTGPVYRVPEKRSMPQ